MRDLGDQTLLVRLHHLARLLRQRQIGCEHLGVVRDLLVLDLEHGAQPAFEPGRRRTGGFRNLLEWRIGPVEPALCNGLAQRRVARKMPVDAAVADIERAGDVDHGGLGEAKAAQHILGGLENTLRSQNDTFVHASSVCFSESNTADGATVAASSMAAAPSSSSTEQSSGIPRRSRPTEPPGPSAPSAVTVPFADLILAACASRWRATRTLSQRCI